MLSVYKSWLVGHGFTAGVAAMAATATGVLVVVFLAVVANLVAKRLVLRAVIGLAGRTQTRWDDVLIERRVFHRFAHIAPALVINFLTPAVLGADTSATSFVTAGCLLYMVVVVVGVADGVLNATVDILKAAQFGQRLPLTSFLQVAKLVLYGLAIIGALSVIIGKSPALLFSGLGAMTAVLMLVFKDPILGLVAGIQLSANRMVTPGDWIEMPKYGADGDVLEVALTTVKVQNFDKTITTIPTYALISESFKNWRGMSESGGRRIKRALNIDMSSIRFCDDAMLERLSRIHYMADYLEEKRQVLDAWSAANEGQPATSLHPRRLTNIGTFRAYVVAYLRNHPKIHPELTFLVRQLAPTEHGLPLEIYVFSSDQDWVAYEGIQADIFDHLLAVMSQFDLRIYQRIGNSGALVQAD
jgi:miniconductance mechanosensitive channel